MDKLAIYSDNNDLNVKDSKTKVFRIRQGGSFSKADKLGYRESEIEFLSSLLYLGIILSTKLSSESLSTTCEKKRNQDAKNFFQFHSPITHISHQFVMPSETNGISVFEIEHTTQFEHSKSSFGVFRKD